MRGFITSGNILYTINTVNLDPGATAVFDVDHLRSAQIPDERGHKLPLDAPYGKFHWFDLSMGKLQGLMGRQSLSSELDHRRSSFSCAADCEFNSQKYPLFDPGVPFNITDGDTASVLIYGHDSYSYGYEIDYNLDYRYVGYSLSATGIVGVGGVDAGYQYLGFSALTAGTVTFAYPYYEADYFINFDDNSCDEYDNNLTVSQGITTATGPPALSKIIENDLTTFSNQTSTDCSGSNSISSAYGYRRCVFYQITDSTNSPISGTATVAESVVVLDSTFQISPITGNNMSNAAGQFADNLRLVTVGSALPSTTCATLKQTFSTGGNVIRVNCLHYGSTDVMIVDVTANPSGCTASC